MIVALSKFTYLIFNAELFSTLKVDWKKGLCASYEHLFLSPRFLAHVANLLGSPHLQPNKEVKESNNRRELLFFRRVPKRGFPKTIQTMWIPGSLWRRRLLGYVLWWFITSGRNVCYPMCHCAFCSPPCFAELILKASTFWWLSLGMDISPSS